MAFWRAVRGALAQAHPMSSQNGCLLELQRGLAAAPGQLDAIKALRERSGAPIGEVKAALTEAAWDPGVRHVVVIDNPAGHSARVLQYCRCQQERLSAAIQVPVNSFGCVRLQVRIASYATFGGTVTGVQQ